MSHAGRCWLHRLDYPNTAHFVNAAGMSYFTTAIFCPACGGDLRSVRQVAAGLCDHCAAGTPHHTVGVSAIGDERRRTIWDLHEVEDTSGVGLAECLAYDAVWKGRE